MEFSFSIVTQVMVLTSLPYHCRPLIFLNSSSYDEAFVSRIFFRDLDQQYFYLFTSCAFVDSPLQESQQHLNQNLNSEFFSVDGFLPERELPRMSSSVSKTDPSKAFAIFNL